MTSDLSVALNRFGLGARPGDAVPTDPRSWLGNQLAQFVVRPSAIAATPSAGAILADVATYLRTLRATRIAGPSAAKMSARAMAADASAAMSDDLPAASKRDAQAVLRAHYVRAVEARVAVSVATATPFVERLVHFWANHFAVSATKIQVAPLAGAFEFEAIRPHVLGRFREMLGAVERHPAMLLYLDQAQSIGPGSRIGQRALATASKRGLNENLAREILELHTLGVRTVYTEADVTEFARALTGWTVAGLNRPPADRAAGGIPGFVFVPAMHEPGARTIAGKSYPEGGEAQAQTALDDLAQHPATARHIAIKLARHFAGDAPPAAMVARLEQAFIRSGGDLPTVYRAIIASPEAWWTPPAKFRTPWEWAIAAMRAIGTQGLANGGGVRLMTQLGQPVWRPAQPDGYDDSAASWAGPDALMRRVEAAERLAARTSAIDARALAARLWPEMLSPTTAQMLSRAESPGQALALMLVAPEALRR